MTGRHGYGSIFVVASGNGGHFHDNCNFDGYANSIFTVTIGAVDELNQMPYYAEQCAAMLAVTYSSGQGHQRNIVCSLLLLLSVFNFCGHVIRIIVFIIITVIIIHHDHHLYHSEAVTRKFSVKQVFLKISQNPQENICARVSFFIKLQAEACNFIKKETLRQVFSCEFCEISKNAFSYRIPPVAVSISQY